MRPFRAPEALAALVLGILLVAPPALAAPAKSTSKHPPSRAAVEERLEEQPVDPSTAIDYDGQAIPQPKPKGLNGLFGAHGCI
jgi:hypothetical protein